MLPAAAWVLLQGVVLRDVKPENFLFLSPADDAPLKASSHAVPCHAVPCRAMQA